MTTPILICDDSGFARRQMARVIPDAWDVTINFAENGEEALSYIRQGKADVMFLDLNMPIMDGYQTMQVIRQEDLPTMVIVVSGDVQPAARERMLAMGALDFIRKPVDNAKLVGLLHQYGIFSGAASADGRSASQTNESEAQEQGDGLDLYKEMANVAMGRAGERLAKVLGAFINLPIPNVNLIETNELHMAIADIKHNESVSAVSMGFISAGISGEALVIFNDADFGNMVKLLKYQNQHLSEQLELEALMDVSNILISACITALSEQLNVNFSSNHPIILGRHCGLNKLLSDNISRWNKVLAIEIAYAIENQDINFDLLLLFPDSSMDNMFNRLVNASE